MTEYEFTIQCSCVCRGLIRVAAVYAIQRDNINLFIQELIEQDNDPGSSDSLRQKLGEELYQQLKKFK